MDPLENNETVVTVPDQDATAAPETVETPTPVEQASGEQAPKTFTQEELDRIVSKEKAKAKRQVERDLASRATEQSQFANIPADQLTPEQQIEVLAERKAQEKLAKQTVQRQYSKFQDRVEDSREKYPDFDQVFHNDLPVSAAMAETITVSDIGPDIAYWLGKNPSEAARISALSPLLQAREIGKIESKLENQPAPVKKTSAAPAPIVPLNSKASVPAVDTTDPRSDKELNDSQWIELENARVRAKLKASRG